VSFWEKATGVAAAPTSAPIHPQGYPQFTSQQAPSAVMLPAGYPQTPQAQPQSMPTEEQQAIANAMAKAQSSRSNLSCPDCGSENIFKPRGMPNAMEQCYHCGWNPRYTQSTAGAGMPSTAETGPARPTRQISTANNFNPQGIVAKVTL
jgi:predicted RNA-binding Zn-ribbon protein involved in translation (DUF1610 family)